MQKYTLDWRTKLLFWLMSPSLAHNLLLTILEQYGVPEFVFGETLASPSTALPHLRSALLMDTAFCS